MERTKNYDPTNDNGLRLTKNVKKVYKFTAHDVVEKIDNSSLLVTYLKTEFSVFDDSKSGFLDINHLKILSKKFDASSADS